MVYKTSLPDQGSLFHPEAKSRGLVFIVGSKNKQRSADNDSCHSSYNGNTLA